MGQVVRRPEPVPTIISSEERIRKLELRPDKTGGGGSGGGILGIEFRDRQQRVTLTPSARTGSIGVASDIRVAATLRQHRVQGDTGWGAWTDSGRVGEFHLTAVLSLTNPSQGGSLTVPTSFAGTGSNAGVTFSLRPLLGSDTRSYMPVYDNQGTLNYPKRIVGALHLTGAPFDSMTLNYYPFDGVDPAAIPAFANGTFIVRSAQMVG